MMVNAQADATKRLTADDPDKGKPEIPSTGHHQSHTPLEIPHLVLLNPVTSRNP